MPENQPAFAITPDTKVGEMLERHPELEDELIGISPAYKALRNPVLRRTVAKVATLRQVAKVGNVPLATLIGRLRSAIGLEQISVEGEETVAERPEWATAAAIVSTYDARADIEAGRHPMPQVMTALGELAPGQTYLLITGFVPEPLIGLAREKGFQSFTNAEASGLVHTYFSRAGAGPA